MLILPQRQTALVAKQAAEVDLLTGGSVPPRRRDRLDQVEGADEQVIGVGISPLPVQRPIPIWIGGSSPRAYQRIGSATPATSTPVAR